MYGTHVSQNHSVNIDKNILDLNMQCLCLSNVNAYIFCIPLNRIAYVRTAGDFNKGTLKKFSVEYNITNDGIRLVKVKSSFQWKTNVRPACLPDKKRQTKTGTKCMRTDLTGE